MINPRSRNTMIGLVGAYLVYLGYQLFQGRNAPDTTMAPALLILFAVVFAVAGVGLMAYACLTWKNVGK